MLLMMRGGERLEAQTGQRKAALPVRVRETERVCTRMCVLRETPTHIRRERL